MGGPRNNLSRHPAEIRFRVYALHYEGKTAAEINADPAVAASVSMTGYRLHGNTLTAAFRSAEYKRYIASRERTFAATEADRITQAVLGEAGALSSVTDVARYELAREIRELIDSSLKSFRRKTASSAAGSNRCPPTIREPLRRSTDL